MEIWKDINGYEGKYQVSNLGNVKSLNYKGGQKERLLKQHNHADGYLRVGLCKNGKQRLYLTHRLVAIAFIGNYANYSEVNHKDENKQNNNANNLEWCNRAYNMNYGTQIERVKAKTSKPVLQYNLQGEFIKKWQGAREIERELNIAHTAISACCLGKQQTAYGFIWKFEGAL